MKIIEQLPKQIELLNPSERLRLDKAVDVYNATLTANAQYQYDRQTPRERKRHAIGFIYEATISEYRARLKAYKKDPIATWWAQALRWTQMSSGGVYKSALLQRILEGKSPLPHAPPCSYSYPWYSIVEEPGAHVVIDVSLRGSISLGSLMKGASGAASDAPAALKDRGITSILINQTSYAITGANQAGIDLLLTIADMAQTPDGMAKNTSVMNAGEEEYPIATPNHPLLSKVRDAYARAPEIFVQHGLWPAWRLFVAPQGPRITYGKWGQKILDCPSFSRNNAQGINPLSLIFEGLNAKLVPNEPEEQERSPAAVDHALKRIILALNGRDPNIEPEKNKEYTLSSAELEQMVKIHDPDQGEKITLQWDVWHIEYAK